MESQVISGYEQDGDIFVTVVLADGDVKGKNGLGYRSKLLEEWHKAGAWIGRVQNSHPSRNHPLVYEPKPVKLLALGESAVPQLAEYYQRKSAKWAFGTYIKTKLVDLKNGSKRLLGLFRIDSEGARQAWREGKFPKFNSMSSLNYKFDKDGFVEKGIPVGSTSVEIPAYGEDVGKIHNQCVGGPDKCVHEFDTKLGESSADCEYCRYTVLTSYKNNFSSHSSVKLSESSMVDSNDGSQSQSTGEEQKPTGIESEGKVVDDSVRIKGDDTEETKPEEEKIDWKTKFEESEKARKKLLKDSEEYKTDTNQKLEKIIKEKLESKIRVVLEKIPLFAFDNKEENREAEVKAFMKFYPRLTEEEIVEQATAKYMLAPKMKAAVEKAKLGESGITNDGKLIADSNNQSNSNILNLDEVFG
ncbi:hypothetical protein [Serratia sp. (in: enterobacteria)]|uniref:hypothetical protein n=1 Tax=Serratia sp. (in: enterobacteria) TaxID=616 RepID=UPI003988FBA2